MSNSVAAAFGAALREARQAAGLSQHQLGRRAGVTVNYPGLMERARSVPTLTVILRLARALDIRPEALVTRTMQLLGDELRL